MGLTARTASIARAVSEITWIVDSATPEVDSRTRLLRRWGSVVDVAGMTLDEAAETIAATGADGIFTLIDDRLVWTAQIAERLGLRSISSSVAERATDKYLQRRALADGGVAGPGFWPIPAAQDADAWKTLASQVRYPAMLKPRRSAGSSNVVRVDSFDELLAHMSELPGALATQPGQMLVEEYLADRPVDLGTEFAGYVSVESFIAAGRTSHLAITGRFAPAEPFRETGYFIPAALGRDEQAAVLETATRAIDAIGVTTGSLHTEIKLTPDGPRVLELNARLAGSPIPELVAAALGIEPLSISMRLALGEVVRHESKPVDPRVRYEMRIQPPMSMHRVIALEGLDGLLLDPRVDAVEINRGPGQEVDWRRGNWQHLFAVNGAAADHQQLSELARKVLSQTRVVGE
jgi:biotin carboxylase